MNRADVYTKFPQAKETTVFIETITRYNSAFGTTSEGDRVFLNTRLIEAVGLQEGDLTRCHVLPNYEDKRDEIPYRAIRAGAPEAQPEPDVLEKPETKPPVQEILYEYLKKVGPTSTSSLVSALNDPRAGTNEVHRACSQLHSDGEIARALVYRTPGQGRASMTLWALSVEEFEVEQELG